MNREMKEYIAEIKREYGTPLGGKWLEDTAGIVDGHQIIWYLNDVISRINPEREYKIDFKLRIP